MNMKTITWDHNVFEYWLKEHNNDVDTKCMTNMLSSETETSVH